MSFKRKALLAVAALSLALLGVELYYRIALPPVGYHRVSTIKLDPVLGHRSVPGSGGKNRDEFGLFDYRHNESGFRGPDLPEGPAAAGVERVLFLGDSFVDAWGVGMERHMLTKLVETLEAERGPTEAFALCCNDWGTGQELLALRQYGDVVAPDTVVLVTFPANDVANNSLSVAGTTVSSTADYIRPYVLTDDSEDAGGIEVTYAHPVRAFFRRRSAAFAHIERSLFLRSLKPGDRFNPNSPILPMVDRLKQGLAPTEDLEVLREHPADHPWSAAWRDTERLIAATRDHAERMGARFVLVVIPSQLQVFQGAAFLWWQENTRNIVREYELGDALDLELPERILAAFCAREDIDAHLMLDEFRAAAAEGTVVYGLDAHLNWRGHELIARRVANTLLGNEVPPVEPPRTPGPAPLYEPANMPTAIELSEFDASYWMGGNWAPAGVDTKAGDQGRPLYGEGIIAMPAAGDALHLEVTLQRDLAAPCKLRLSVPAIRTSETIEIQAEGGHELDLVLTPEQRGRLPEVFTVRISATPQPGNGAFLVRRIRIEDSAGAAGG